jgi:hypothetical protein
MSPAMPNAYKTPANGMDELARLRISESRAMVVRTTAIQQVTITPWSD